VIRSKVPIKNKVRSRDYCKSSNQKQTKKWTFRPGSKFLPRQTELLLRDHDSGREGLANLWGLVNSWARIRL